MSLVGVVLAVVGVVLGIAGVDPEPWVWYMGLVDVVHGIDRWVGFLSFYAVGGAESGWRRSKLLHVFNDSYFTWESLAGVFPSGRCFSGVLLFVPRDSSACVCVSECVSARCVPALQKKKN